MAEELNVISSGTWLVGTEVPPGIYRVAGYYARLDSHQGIIKNDNSGESGLSLVVVHPSDEYLEISGEAVSIDQMPSVDPIASNFRSGTYRVGTDIAPGRYRISNTGLAYAARLDHSMNVIDNAANNGNVILQVMPTDFAFAYSGDIARI